MFKRFRGTKLFLTKDDELIHSGKPSKKRSKSGVFLTSCGRVVSTDPESRATAHVGYKIVSAKRATCRECNKREGKAVMDRVRHGRRVDRLF